MLVSSVLRGRSMEEKEEVRHSVLALHGIFLLYGNVRLRVQSRSAVCEFGRGVICTPWGFLFRGRGRGSRFGV